MPVIPTLGRLRQEGLQFKARLGYRARSCLSEILLLGQNLKTKY
jgi:hypothetical protein